MSFSLSQINNNIHSDDYILSFSNVKKDFTVKKSSFRALKDITVNIKKQTITGLVGPDGAGKTTLIRLGAGLYLPESGNINALGMDIIKNKSNIQSKIGYMPQKFGLYEDLTIDENLHLYADLFDLDKKIRQERFDELLNLTALKPFGKRLAGRLSGGMKQKLGLACILINRPSLLLLDEPTVGVDPLSRLEIWKILKKLRDSDRISIFMSTAYLNETDNCDEVILLHNGEVLAMDVPENLKKTVYKRTFILRTLSNNKREYKKYLQGFSDVLDTNPVSDGIRFITKTSEPLIGNNAFNNMDYYPVEPNFEDYFVDKLISLSENYKSSNLSENIEIKTSHLNDIKENTQNNSHNTLIMLNNLTRIFGDFYAVNNISFDVKQGEIFGLLGANGAGKSTTFRMLCGLLPPSSGKISVAGYDMRTAPAMARQRIGYMSQKFSLYGNLSAIENMDFFSSTYGLKGKYKKQRILWALDNFELKEVAETKSITLPLGYKQRLSLACALLHEPDIVFLDEPTSGVDPLARREFWEQIGSLSEEGVTTLVTTHFMDEAEYCDRIAIMSEGKILCIGSPEDIKNMVKTSEISNPSLEDAFIQLTVSGNFANA